MRIPNRKTGISYRIVGVHEHNDYYISDMKAIDFPGPILHGLIGAPENIQKKSDEFWDPELLRTAVEEFQQEVIFKIEKRISKS